LADWVQKGRHFGDVLAEANASYFVGRGHHDTEINVTFVGANPRQVHNPSRRYGCKFSMMRRPFLYNAMPHQLQ
jgi:hypothetical protein